MKTVLNFIDNWGLRITFLLVLIIFVKTCGTSTSTMKTDKKVEQLSVKIDSINNHLIKEIKVEGLKSEKRMIQATDRKIMDVNRQSEIDKEIKEILND